MSSGLRDLRIWQDSIALGGDVNRREIFVWYQLGQMAKYLPGGVGPLMGRGEMATRGGTKRSLASLAYTIRPPATRSIARRFAATRRSRSRSG